MSTRAVGLGTGGTGTYQASVTGGGPLKISLVWSDFASTAAASVNLVNDLDLEVTAPGGTVYRGNVFSGGWAATGGSADRRNNVENVYIQSAAAGTWTVTVRGFNVPSGPQPYALVVDGAATLTVPPPSNTGLASPTTNASETGGDNNGFQTNPANAHTDNATFAVDTNSGSNTNTSCTNAGKDKHRFYNYGLSIPGAATIKGVTVRLDARADATGRRTTHVCAALVGWRHDLDGSQDHGEPDDQRGQLYSGRAARHLGAHLERWPTLATRTSVCV